MNQTYNFTTNVIQSFNNRTRFTSYMRAGHADLGIPYVPF